MKKLTWKIISIIKLNIISLLDNSSLQHIDKQYIADLILVSNEHNIEIIIMEYTKSVYEIILNFFKNLKHLSIVQSSVHDYPALSLCSLPPMTFSSSTLTKLRISIGDFDDCLALFDRRLKNLATLTVQLNYIYHSISTSLNTVS